MTCRCRSNHLKDIVTCNAPAKSQALEELFDSLAASSGFTTPSRIADKLQSPISAETAKSYTGYLQESRLLRPARRFDIKGRKYSGTQHKYFFEDISLRNIDLRFRRTEETPTMENVIFNELRLRGFDVDAGCIRQRCVQNGRQLTKRCEVDFVANRGSLRIYIQTARKLTDKEDLREKKAILLAIRDAFKKAVIVGEPIKTAYDEDGIFYISIFDFLLNPDSLLR